MLLDSFVQWYWAWRPAATLQREMPMEIPMGGTSSAEVSGEAAASSGQAAVSEGTGERQMISISTLDYNAGSNNVGEYAEEIRQKMQEYTGVDFEITWVSSDALEEKNALYMANPATMPKYYYLERHIGRSGGRCCQGAELLWI